MADDLFVVEGDEEYDRRIEDRTAFFQGLPQAEQQARSAGSHFSTMGYIWGASANTIENSRDEWFKPIERSSAQGQHIYQATTLDSNLKHPMSQSDASSATNTDQTRTKFDFFQNTTSERAHLFPDARECHKAYGFLAQSATGKNVGDPVERLKLLNGVKQPAQSRRTTGSGLKHHKFNKMYLFMQKEYFDCNVPRLIIIPIMELSDVLGWNGEDEYDVMAITVGGGLGTECARRLLEFAPSECTENEVRTATRLLETFIKGVAWSVVYDTPDEAFDPSQLDFRRAPMTNLKRWALLRHNLQSPGSTIMLPHLHQDVDWETVTVAKATASLHSSLPDPYNMAVRAAVNFSAIMRTKLMPACKEEELHSDSSSSDGEINSDQHKDEWPENGRRENFSSLLRSFGHPVG